MYKRQGQHPASGGPGSQRATPIPTCSIIEAGAVDRIYGLAAGLHTHGAIEKKRSDLLFEMCIRDRYRRPGMIDR